VPVTDVLVVDHNRTVRRIVERTLRLEGYRVHTAECAAEALRLAEAERPAIVLVDAHLPRLGGDGPALDCEGFVAALGEVDNLRGIPIVTMSARGLVPGAADQEGRVLDSIRKPFSPEALVAVLASASARARARAETRDDDTDGVPTRDLPLLAEVAIGEDDALIGRLEHVPLADVLQLLHAQQQTGTLEVRGEDVGIAIGLSRGAVDQAIGRAPGGAALRLGRYLVEANAIEPEDLAVVAAAQQAARAAGRRRDAASWLGALLVKRGHLTREQLLAALTRQTTDLVVEALRVRRGTFRFVRLSARPEAAEARLGLPLSGLLLDGLRRVDEWRVLEERVRSFDMVLEPDPLGLRSLGEDRLTLDERSVLHAFDGARTLRDVASACHMAPLDVARIAHQLLLARVARATSED
jgi:CheY-like chemotaxis protein